MKIEVKSGLSAVLAGILMLAPLAAEAQQPATTPDATQTQTQQPDASPAQTQQPTSTNPGDNQGPLEPVPTTPDQQNAAPATPQPQAQQPAQNGPAQAPQKQNQSEPLGTATAPGVSSVGGGASKPAGTAIAPAKQRQYRSFLIKLGLIAGIGAAAGTVYALSRGTSSTPPGATATNRAGQ